MLITITLLVALSILGVYYYDKNHSKKERNLILKKYLKKNHKNSMSEINN